jgi:hypothetical protein
MQLTQYTWLSVSSVSKQAETARLIIGRPKRPICNTGDGNVASLAVSGEACRVTLMTRSMQCCPTRQEKCQRERKKIPPLLSHHRYVVKRCSLVACWLTGGEFVVLFFCVCISICTFLVYLELPSCICRKSLLCWGYPSTLSRSAAAAHVQNKQGKEGIVSPLRAKSPCPARPVRRFVIESFGRWRKWSDWLVRAINCKFNPHFVARVESALGGFHTCPPLPESGRFLCGEGFPILRYRNTGTSETDYPGPNSEDHTCEDEQGWPKGQVIYQKKKDGR